MESSQGWSGAFGRILTFGHSTIAYAKHTYRKAVKAFSTHHNNITIIKTNEEAELKARACLNFLGFPNMSTKLFIEALRDDEQHCNMRLAHLGDLVQNLLLCDIAYTGSSAREDFMETKLKRKVCKNKDQWEMVKKVGLRKFMFYQQTDTRDKRRTHPIRDKRFADAFEAVIGAMYKESGRDWKPNCLTVMRKLKLDFAAARDVVGRQDQEFEAVWDQVIVNEEKLRSEGLWFL